MIKTILIAEDDRDSNDYLAFFLRKQYEHVFSAYNGIEAWNLYEKHMPDLIIADIEMPKMDGLKLIERIRQKDKNTHIVILSAYSHTHYLLKAVPMQLEEYIVKPITFDKINALLSQINSKEEINKENRLYIIDKASNTFYNYESKTAYIGVQRIVLANLEITLLELLLANHTEIVHYSEIEETLYASTLSSRNALKCLVKNLRAKIPTITIRSIPKIGYLLL